MKVQMLEAQRRWMLAVGAACALLTVLAAAGTSVAYGGTPPAADIKLTKVVDITTVKGELTALKQPGSTTVVLLFREENAPPRVFVGTSTLLFEQEMMGFTSSPPNMQSYMLAPRAQPKGRTTLELFEGNYAITCGDKDTIALATLAPAEVAKVLANATFRSSAVAHSTAMLARDAAGIYYFVDRLREAFGGSGFRVFVGKRGKLKQLPLVDVADDEAGMVFETKSGEIRLTMDKNKERTVTWNVKGKTKNLTWLDPHAASYLISRELGIYTGFGTLCDDR